MDWEREDYFGTEELLTRQKKFLSVIIYDISDNKRRNQMAKYLEQFGHRVQRSAFEAWQDNKTFSKLCDGIEKRAHPEDYIKVYRLKGVSEVFSWGQAPTISDEDVIII